MAEPSWPCGDHTEKLSRPGWQAGRQGADDSTRLTLERLEPTTADDSSSAEVVGVKAAMDSAVTPGPTLALLTPLTLAHCPLRPLLRTGRRSRRSWPGPLTTATRSHRSVHN